MHFKLIHFNNICFTMKSQLLNLKKAIPLCCLIMVLFSCRSHKELIYLRDANGNEQLTGTAQTLPVYRIQKKDNLFVSILSANPDLNKLYNPADAGNNGISTANQYENQGEQFISGYEVDGSGAVDLPIIGKVNVAGKTVA